MSEVRAPAFDDCHVLGADALYYEVVYPNGLRFGIDAHGRDIYIDNYDGIGQRELTSYLAGPVICFALRLQGCLCVHAGVVAIDGYAVAFMAPSGGGKSTTVASLAAIGFPVLSDDVLLTLPGEGGRYYAQAGFPWIRLCNDAKDTLLSKQWEVYEAAHKQNKKVVPLPQGGYQWFSQPLPLLAIYTAVDSQANLRFESLSGAQAIHCFLGNMYPGPVYRLPQENRKIELEKIRDLALSVPLRGVSYQRDFSELASFRDGLVMDARSLIANPCDGSGARN